LENETLKTTENMTIPFTQKKDDPIAEGDQLFKKLNQVINDREDKNPDKYGDAITKEQTGLVNEFNRLLARQGYHARPSIIDGTVGVHGIQLEKAKAVHETALAHVKQNEDAIASSQKALEVTALRLLGNLPSSLVNAWAKAPGLKFALEQTKQHLAKAEGDFARAKKVLAAWEEKHSALATLMAKAKEYNAKTTPFFHVNGGIVPEGNSRSPEEQKAFAKLVQAGQNEAEEYLAEALK
jgi:hypothetical protein